MTKIATFDYDFGKFLRRFSSQKNEGLYISIKCFIVTRFTLILLGYSITHEFALHGIFKPNEYKFSDNNLLNFFGTYDSGWYLHIAKNWYPIIQHNSNGSFSEEYSFFPLYPTLIKLVHILTRLNYFYAGLLVSNISILFSGHFLYEIALKKYDRLVAKQSVLLMYSFPVAFIYSGVFTESLYLLLILMAINAAFSEKWILAGFSAMLLTVCRSIGVFVFFPLLIIYLQSINYNLSNIRRQSLFLLLIPLGVGLLMMIYYQVSSDPFIFTHNPGYKGEINNPFANLYFGLRSSFFTYKFLSIFTLAYLLLWVLFYKMLPLYLHIIVLYSIFVPLSYGLMSMPRMLLAAFPFYFLLSKVSIKYKIFQPFLFVSVMSQCYLFVCWCLGFGNVI